MNLKNLCRVKEVTQKEGLLCGSIYLTFKKGKNQTMMIEIITVIAHW